MITSLLAVVPALLVSVLTPPMAIHPNTPLPALQIAVADSGIDLELVPVLTVIWQVETLGRLSVRGGKGNRRYGIGQVTCGGGPSDFSWLSWLKEKTDGEIRTCEDLLDLRGAVASALILNYYWRGRGGQDLERTLRLYSSGSTDGGGRYARTVMSMLENL